MPSNQLLAAAHSLTVLGVSLVLAAAPALGARSPGTVRRAAPVATVRTIVEHLSSKAPAYVATLDVPQLVWSERSAVSGKVNVAIVTWAEGQVRVFAAQVRTDLAKAKGLPASLPESNLHLTYKLERLDPNVLSLRLTVEAYVRGQASPSQVPAGLTFDLANGTAYTLSEIFRPHAAYLPALARAAHAGLKSFHPAGARCYLGLAGPSATANAFAVWWLEGQSLVLAYPAGQYTAAYCGPPTVPIPARSLGRLLAPGGPLAA